MRDVDVREITTALKHCIEEASFTLGDRETAALRAALERETHAPAKAILTQLLENREVAKTEVRPLCQDTGVAVVFLEIGQEVHLTGGELEPAIHAAVGEGYTELHLRKSMLDHPLRRVNTGDNTPAVIHTRIVSGETVRIFFDAKGGGCENMSAVAMLPPAAGREGVVDFVVRTVRDAGGNPCPPVVVGVGLGGNFEAAALGAKRSLLRPLGEPAADADDAALERDLLGAVNATGVGPMGLGGATTALAVHVDSRPCHLASLPVAVNLDCHSHRHAEAVI